MKPKLFLSLLLLVISVLLFGAASASTLYSYDLDWWTVDGGGGTSEGGIYSLGGTIGQPDTWQMAGGVYILEGGFWVGGEANPPEHRLFLPLVQR